MDLLAILMNSLWAGLFAGGMGILLTAPPRYIVPTFLCGFAGRFARDAFMSWGMSQNWSTAVAAAVVVLVAVAVIRRHVVSPVVVISGVLPLGAAVAMFNAIIELMKVSSLKGEALSASSVALSANTGKVFTTSLAIAVGLGAGIAIVRFLRRDEVQEGV
jgi:uncharacterized membrane protein YjjB (DUF3815 family)